MTQKKICVLGSLNVGKTSLVQRFIEDVFDGTRRATIGVKIARKTIRVDDVDTELVVWDMYGENKYQKIQKSYLSNASGYILVVDGTRKETLATAVELRDRVNEQGEHLPYVLVVNKADLQDEWTMSRDDWAALAGDARAVYLASAKTATRVEDAFTTLTKAMLATDRMSATA